jgi:hypothetical protein
MVPGGLAPSRRARRLRRRRHQAVANGVDVQGVRFILWFRVEGIGLRIKGFRIGV